MLNLGPDESVWHAQSFQTLLLQYTSENEREITDDEEQSTYVVLALSNLYTTRACSQCRQGIVIYRFVQSIHSAVSEESDFIYILVWYLARSLVSFLLLLETDLMPLVCNLPMSYYEQVLSTQFVLSLDRITSHIGNVWCLVFELDGKRYIFILSGSCSYLVFNSPLVLFIVNQIVSRQPYVMSHGYANIGAITKIILVFLSSIPLTTNLNNSLVTKPAVIKKYIYSCITPSFCQMSQRSGFPKLVQHMLLLVGSPFVNIDLRASQTYSADGFIVHIAE